MATLTRTKSGLWTSRKVIPADVRECYGKREEKPTWSAHLTHTQARAEFAAWLASIEDKITFLRAQHRGPELHLSPRQALALAGEWYRQLETRFAEEPGDPEAWDVEIEKMLPPETEESYALYWLRRDNQDHLELRPTPFLMAELDALLVSRSLQLSASSKSALLTQMTELYFGFCNLMIRRASGDYGADPRLATLPAWKPDDARAANAPEGAPTVSILALFEGYVAERCPAPATQKAWGGIAGKLIEFLGHGEAAKVSGDDMVRWKDQLLQQGLSAKTVTDKYIAAMKTIFAWGVDNRKVTENPVTGVKVRAAKVHRLREKHFTDAEARTILAATLKPVGGRVTEESARALRWVPWLCAYSGARVGEITQLRKEDVRQEEGIWFINITPEAGSTKNGQARKVPLHSHLVDQGLVEALEKWPEGPIFYNPASYRGGRDGSPQSKKIAERLARWVRSLGVDDPSIQPNHAWRHRFKTEARSAGIDGEARDVIPGHAPRTEGQAYGAWTLAALSREIEKLPRIEVPNND